MSDILETPKATFLKLADGKEYELPPINLTTLANMEKTMGFGLSKLHDKIAEETAGTLRLMVYALLKETNPHIGLEETGNLVTFDVMKNISEVLSQIMAVEL